MNAFKSAFNYAKSIFFAYYVISKKGELVHDVSG